MPTEKAIPHPKLYDRSLRYAISPFIRAFYGRIAITGAENMEKLEGQPFILAPVHRSQLDIPITALAARQAGRQVAFVAKSELWQVPLLRSYIEACGAFPVERGQAPVEAFEQEVDAVLESGGVLGIFPEGKRVKGDTVSRKQLKRSVAAIALKHGVPLVPLGIAGTEKGRRGPLQAVVGPPIAVEQHDAVRVADPFTYSRLARPVLDKLHEALSVCQAEALQLQAKRG